MSPTVATSQVIAGHPALLVSEDAAPLSEVRQFTDLIGDCMGEGVHLLVIPASVLAPEFFQLRTGLAGEVLQKMVNYHLVFAVLGDVSRWTTESKAFHDLVVEAERGTDLFFAGDRDELERKLTERIPAA